MGNTASDSSDLGTLVLIELWFRPLASKVAASVGGEHSFLVLCFSKQGLKTYFLVEKLHTGNVKWTELDRNARKKLAIQRANKEIRLERSACRVGGTKQHLEGGIREKDVREITDRHTGHYDVHSANCHSLSQEIWNRCVEKSKEIKEKPQSGLSRLAKFLGGGASMQSHAQTRDKRNACN